MFLSNLKKPPGPGLYDHLDENYASKLDYYLDITRTYGDIVKMPGPVRTFLINNPDTVQYILQNNLSKYPKGGLAMLPLKRLFGESTLVMQGEAWQYRRQLLQPFFYNKSIQQFELLITSSAVARFQTWDHFAHSQLSFDITHEMMTITLKIAASALFNYELSNTQTQALIKDIALQNKHASSLLGLLPFFPSIKHFRYYRAKGRLNKLIAKLISAHRQNNHPQHNLLHALLEGTDQKKLSQQHLYNEIKTFLLTGHETTGTALSWACYLLAKHPQVMTKLQTELDDVLQGGIPTHNDLTKLPYLQMVFDEVLRLYPPIWITGRKTTTAENLSNYNIPAKSHILICPYTLHRHPDIWEHPDEFIPERFSEEQKQSRHRFAYIPFGGGQRVCIAGNFAMLQGLLVLACLAQRYNLELDEEHQIEIEHLISLKPGNGVKVRVRTRTSS